MLFITLPFLGGWIGYLYAPGKVVEVEKVIVKEVKVVDVEADIASKLHPSLHASELSEGMLLYRDVSSTYIDLGVLDPEGDKQMPVSLISGDVDADSVFVSSDKKFVSFRGYKCSRVLGGHCFGAFYVRNTAESKLSNNQEHQIKLRGDEQSPYNLAVEPDSVAPGPLYQFGTFTGWDSENKLNLDIDYEGVKYRYRSITSEEPWVLEYLGAAN